MTPELDELIRLYAAFVEAREDDKKRALGVFRQRCGEISAQKNLCEETLAAFAIGAHRKQERAAEKRLGRP